MADYNEIAKQLRTQQGQTVGTSLYNAADVDPDKEGFLTQLSKRTGIPVTSLRVKDIERDALRVDVANKYEGIVQGSPNLATWLSTDQQNANLAHDDTDNLGLIDTLINSTKRGMVGLSALSDRLQVANQAAGLQQFDYVDQALARGETPDESQLGVMASQYAKLSPEDRSSMRARMQPAMEQRLGEAVSYVAQTQRDIADIQLPAVAENVSKAKTFGEAFSAFGNDPLKFIAAVGPESLVQSAPGIAAAVPAGMTAGPLGVAGVMGASSALTEYSSSLISALQDAGVNTQDPQALMTALQDRELLANVVRQAGIRAGVVGAFDAVSGGLAGKTLLPAKTLVTRPLARELANVGVQAPVQGLLGAGGEAAASVAAGQDVKPGELLGEFFGEFFGAPVDVVAASAGRLREQLHSAAKAEQNTQLFKDLDKLAAASKVRQRDADTFENFVAQASADAPLQNVYIDAQALMQSGVGEQVAAVSPSVAEQLPAALVSGGTIRIPVDEYMGRIAGTELSQPLIEHLRDEPNGFSQNEAREFLQTYQEDLKAEVEQALGAKQADETFKQSGKAVEDRVFTELENAGRFKSDVNRAYASLHRAFAETMASKLGMTPEQFHDKYGVKVVNRALGGQEFSQFAGQQAHTADMYALLNAQERIAKGESDERVRRETGWHLGVDGRWRFEIPDDEAKFNNKGTVSPEILAAEIGDQIVVGPDPKTPGTFKATFGEGDQYRGAFGRTEEAARENLLRVIAKDRSVGAFDIAKVKAGDVMPLSVVLDHPKLYAAYPDLADTTVKFVEGVDYRGAHYSRENRIDIAMSGDHEQMLSTLLHEVQHAIQHREGFAAGGNSDTDFVRVVRAALDNMEDRARKAVDRWKESNQDKLNAAEKAAQVARYGLMYASAQRLIDYANRDKPSGVFRLMRNELQWIYSPEFAENETARELQRDYYGIPKSGPKRNQRIGDMAFRGAQMILDHLPADLRQQFKDDPRTLKSMVAALSREANRARKGLQPLHNLEKTARRASGVRAALRYSTPFEVYRALAGEVEARNTQARQRMTEQERQDTSPLQTADVPAEHTIVMFGGLDIRAPMAAFPQDATLNQSAFHGSPYRFDQFTLDHIGTGEGAQAYGWGLYFAGNRQVAEYYRNVLSADKTRVTLDGVGISLDEAQRKIADAIYTKNDVSKSKAAEIAQTIADGMFQGDSLADFKKFVQQSDWDAEEKAAYTSGLDYAGRYGVERVKGQLYEADIPEDDVLLAWDKPLSEQPDAVKTALEKLNWIDPSVFSEYTGQQLYENQVRDAVTFNGTPRSDASREVSLALNAAGIKGIKYLDGSSRAAGEGNHNFVIFDDSAIKVLNTFYQSQQNQPARGTFNPATNTIALLKASDLSTFLHESGHYFLETQFNVAAQIAQASSMFGTDTNSAGEQQLLQDTNALLNWFGINSLDEWFSLSFEEKRAYHEKFAESFEAYLFDGKAPTIELQGAFQRFASWLKNVYKSLKDFLARNPAAGELNPEIRQVMDRMLATDEEIQLAEQARSMMPLFTSPDQAGMTVDEFAAYQALGRDATAAAQEDLQSKSLRDLQWYANTKQRQIRKLKKLAAQRRSEVRIEARREVMSQPVYQAWQFLTGKLTPDDKITPKAPPKSDPNRVQPEMDSLFTAIAKLGGLNRAEVEETWGWDEKVPVPVFGKPLLRREGGRSIDGMAEALADRGYLTMDQHGKYDIAELEEKFDDERRGTLRYSNEVDPAIVMPDNSRAGEGINTSALGAGRFDAAELRTMGIPSEITDLIVGLKMTAKNGLHPDIVAERFGFTSGDELVRSLAFAEAPKVAIEALTDTKMLEQYGELSSEEAIAREADKAVHNDLRARMLAAEANALSKATGKRKVLASAAKEFAAQMIARLKVRDVKPGQYTAAETRAGKASEKALRASKLTEAAAEKRNQLVNNYAAKAAYQALDDVERGVRYLKKFEREATRNAIATEYVEQIDVLLERFDLRKISNKALDKRASLATWLESQRDMGLEPEIPENIANEAMRKSYRDMTVEEFRGLVDTVRQIEHLGRLKEKLLTAKDLREYKAVRDLIANSINANAGDRQVIAREARNDIERLQAAARSFGWAHIKASTIARVLDGGKDGGPVWEYFIRSANERGDYEVEQRAKATEDITRILEPVFKMGKMGGKGQFFESIGQSLNRESRIALALNTGNEGNLQRLLGGEGWTMQQIQPVLQSLTAAEWQTVQNIWDYFESYRPEIAAKERRVYGKEPAWVEPKGFTMTTADGQQIELRGGYYPIKYDPKASQRAEEHADADAAKRQLQGAYTSATTRRSFTKTRAEEVNGRPLLLSLVGVYSGLNEVIHDLAWHEWLIDANRLLKSNTIDTAIRSHYGAEFKEQLKNWVKDVAEGDRPAANAAESALSRLRQGVSAAGLGFNVMNAMLQVTGFIPAGVRVGWEWLGKGAARYMGGPITATKQANELSSFMQNRSRTRLRELAEVRNRVQDANQAFTKVNQMAYFLMLRTQQVVDTVTWWGAFEKAMASDPNEERAIALADQAVLDSQGGGQLKDLSAVERGGPALKLFTVYYSYMNTMLNLTVAEQMTNKQRGKRLANQLLVLTVAPMLGLAIKEGLTPDGDDEWDWGKLAKKMAAEQLAFLMGLMVVVREFSDAAKMVAGVAEYSRDYGGPAGLRAVSEIQKLSTQVHQGQIDDAFVRASVNTVGAFSGLPAAQINRTIGGAEALAEDKTDNPAALVLGFQK